jgi:hypothetical protein
MPTTDIQTVRRELQDLAAWRPLLSDAAATVLGVSSPRFTPGGGGASDALPFRLDSILDRTDEGASGIRTPRGLDEVLMSWARQIADSKHDPQPRSALAYLQQAGVLEYAQQHDDWDALCETIHQAHQVIGRITGHTDAQIGTCPWDHARILTTPTRDGIPEHGECEQCGQWYADQDDIARQAHQHWQQEMRRPDAPGTATMDRLVDIWHEPDDSPITGVERKTLEVWAQRGHLIKRPGKPATYLLALANQWIIERLAYGQKRKGDTPNAA